MIAGITGHQELSEYDVNWIRDAILALVRKLHIQCGLTNLAKGIDQMFAEILMHEQIEYNAIIPCRLYEDTFVTRMDKEMYHHYLMHAKSVIVLDNNEPGEQAFYDAGKKVVENSDVVIAVWNGEDAKGLGGTAEIVTYSKAVNRTVFHVNPVGRLTTIL